MTAWTKLKSGVQLHVRLTPRASREAVEGVRLLSDGRAVLQVSVRAVPADGAANEALLRLLAKALDVPLRDITLTAGQSARLKTVSVSGEPEALDAYLLEKWGRRE
ncbi:MAG: DUF167 domain-containing protein [Alphaproteobacteria bacterium]|nr:DUF167 domain-containing protein [Alphaproteobacteria bacterium]